MFFLLYPPPPLKFAYSALGRRPRIRRRHSGRRNFKPGIPSDSEAAKTITPCGVEVVVGPRSRAQSQSLAAEKTECLLQSVLQNK